jgi:CRISPR-associated protein Cas5t
MERILAVQVRATVASFRRPLDHNYQRTLPMPPPTTLIGIAAAALGLSDRQLWASESPLRHLKVSVLADSEPGSARDMWTVLKIKGNKIAERSPYFRELLFFPRYTLLYGGDEDLLHRLEQAFRDPAYPLSLGREDELMLVDEIAIAEAQDGDPRFEGTVLPCDIRQMKGVQVVIKPAVYLKPILVERLPLRFRVDDRGVRHPEEITPLSFLPLGTEMIVPTVKALQWQGRNFAWLNS